MRILIAEDDPVSRRLLENRLRHWGYEVEVTSDGSEAWAMLEREDRPAVAILDWMMPGLDGPAVCRRVRATPGSPVYLILLTTKGGREDTLEGFAAGADDYVTKPFDAAELQARVRVAARTVNADLALAARVQELEAALSQVNQLRGLLPICAYCKRIRDEQDSWHEVEVYVRAHSAAAFSHGICPPCYDREISGGIHGTSSTA